MSAAINEQKAMLAGKILLGVIVAFVVFKIAKALLGIITGITDNLTIGKSGEDERNTAEALADSPLKKEAVKYFNPTYGFKAVVEKYGKTMSKYYVNKAGFSDDDAVKIARQIYDANGKFNDDEQKVYSALNQIPSLCCLSLVAFKFQYFYKQSLFAFISGFLDGKELETSVYLISKKPIY